MGPGRVMYLYQIPSRIWLEVAKGNLTRRPKPQPKDVWNTKGAMNEKSMVPFYPKLVFHGGLWDLFALPSDYQTRGNTPENGEVVVSPLFLLSDEFQMPVEQPAAKSL